MFIAMESKRLSFSEPFLSQRRKVISGFSFGIGASLAIFIVLLLNNSLKVPKVQFLLQGFDSVDANSSFASWPFSLSNNPSSSSSSPTSSASNNNFTASSKLQHAVTSVQQMEKGSVADRTPGVNVSDAPKNDAMKSYVGNLTQEFDNVSLHTDEQRVQQKIHEANGTLAAEKVNQWGSIGQGVSSSKIPSNNSSDIGKNVTLLGEESRITVDSSLSSETNMEKQKTIEGDSLKNSSFSTAENDSVSSASYSGKPGVEGKYEGNSVEKNNVTGFHDGAHPQEMQIGSYENCDIFDGKWIRDDSKPYYPLGSCPHIDRDFDCHRNGRPDGDYVKWKWQPNGCNMPSLNATDFLERLRGQKLVFVGDSLNRNMWESLVCILRQSLRYKKRVYEISGRTEFKKKGFYAFRFEDYNCSVDFVGCPFLVRESTYAGKNGSIETLRLDLMDQTTSMYQDADIIIFNTGHWWTHEKTSRGEDYYQEGNHVYPRLKVLNAYTRALTTWARWIDHNIDANRTQVFFRGYSLTHFRGGQWNSGGQCNKEIEPIFNETYLRKYPSKMRALEHVIAKMKTPVVYMNISKLTDYRKDGHPSIYRMQYKTETDRNSAELYQDCSHWCLPGVPDTWNELLYATLLKNGKGSWKK